MSVMVRGQITHLIEVFCTAARGLGSRPHGKTGDVPIAYFGFGELAILDCRFDDGDANEIELIPRQQQWVCIRAAEAKRFRAWPQTAGNGKRLSAHESAASVWPWADPAPEGTTLIPTPPGSIGDSVEERGAIDADLSGLVAYREDAHRPPRATPVTQLPDLGAVVLLGCVRCGLGMRDASWNPQAARDVRRLRTASPSRVRVAVAADDSNRTPVRMSVLSRRLDAARLAGLARAPLSVMVMP